MASSLSYVEYVKEQMSGAGTVTHRRMFGEYGLFCDGKYFGVVCGDRALVKITPAGEALVPDCPRGIPYEGGGEMFLPDVEDRETLAELVRVTCAALPEKKSRKKKKRENAVYMKLDGFGLLVEDMPAMVRFYRDVMGFEIKEPEDAVNVYMVKDGTVFMLYRRSDFEKMTGRTFRYVRGMNGRCEMALQVENYDAVDRAFREVTAKGAAAVMEPETMPWGQRTCYVADPEGNLIEIGAFAIEERQHG